MNCFGYLIIKVLCHLKRSTAENANLSCSVNGRLLCFHPLQYQFTHQPSTTGQDRIKTQCINISSIWSSASKERRADRKSLSSEKCYWHFNPNSPFCIAIKNECVCGCWKRTDWFTGLPLQRRRRKVCFPTAVCFSSSCSGGEKEHHMKN